MAFATDRFFRWACHPRRLGLIGVLGVMLTWGIMSGWPLSLQLLRFYPKKLGSAAIGWVAERSLPRWARAPLLGRFARAYSINLAEAQYPIQDYSSLQAFFTRRLKSGSRPQDAPAPGNLNSPVDAQIVACGRIEKGLAIQAKAKAEEELKALIKISAEEDNLHKEKYKMLSGSSPASSSSLISFSIRVVLPTRRRPVNARICLVL